MLLAVLPVLTAFGFGILFVRLVQTGSFLLCPWFTAYCLALTLYYPLWDASSRDQISIQIFILSLRTCAAIESLILAMEPIGVRERRWLVAFVALVVTLGVSIAADLNYGVGELSEYRHIHQTVNVGIGLGSFAVIGYFWIDPPITKPRLRAHGAIFTLLAMGHAVSGFLKPWRHASEFFFLVSLGCIALWLWGGLLSSGKHSHGPLHFPKTVL